MSPRRRLRNVAVTAAVSLFLAGTSKLFSPEIALLITVPVLLALHRYLIDERLLANQGALRAEAQRSREELASVSSHVSELASELKVTTKSVDTLIQLAAPALVGRASVGHPFADGLLEIARRNVHQVIPRKLLSGESEIYVALTELVGAEVKGPQHVMLALCVDKTWSLRSLGEYFRSNLDAVQIRRGHIHRIFVEGKSAEQREAVRQEAEDQAAFGINVRVIGRDAYKVIAKSNGLPESFGFTIFGHKVFVHWGLGEAAKGVLIESDAAAQETMRIYRLIEANATKVVRAAKV